jgi:hypothetical protein
MQYNEVKGIANLLLVGYGNVMATPTKNLLIVRHVKGFRWSKGGKVRSAQYDAKRKQAGRLKAKGMSNTAIAEVKRSSLHSYSLVE